VLYRHLKSRRFLSVLFCTSLLLCLSLGTFPRTPWHGENAAIAQSTEIQQLQAGMQRYQSGDIPGAIQIWQTVLTSMPGLTNVGLSDAAINVRKYLVQAYQQVGQMDAAIPLLEELRQHHRAQGEWTAVGRILTEQAQLYSQVGQQRQAFSLLCSDRSKGEAACTAESALAIARRQADLLGEAAALGSLGKAYRLQGEFESALYHLKQSLALAQRIKQETYQLSALSSIGNVYANLAQRDYRRQQFAEQAKDEVAAQKFAQSAIEHDVKAGSYYKDSLKLAQRSGDTNSEVGLLLNLAASLQRTHLAPGTVVQKQESRDGHPANLKRPMPDALLQQAQTVLDRLPNSRTKAFATLRLANALQLTAEGVTDLDRNPTTECFTTPPSAEVLALLNQTITIAQQIQDQQAQAFALGQLGHVYECQQNFEQAFDLTQKARLAATTSESQYLWEWQTGRILKAQGQKEQAIEAYHQAIKTLEALRGDLILANRELQFDFRDTVEPIYRQLTALYLDQATQAGTAQANVSAPQTKEVSTAVQESAEDSTPLISAALTAIDGLRLAELQNYLGDDCTLEVNNQPLAAIDAKTAVLSSVILDDRVAIILTLPTGDQQRVRSFARWIDESQAEVTATVNDLRQRAERRSDLANTYRAPAEKLYDWLIRPFEAELKRNQIETLVFVQDGILRSIPMAVLYDGQQFLIEQYAIANTLSLNLIEPSRLRSDKLQVLAFGLTEPSTVEGPIYFAPLQFVKSEIDAIQTTFPKSKGFLDQEFTIDRLQQELAQNQYSIIHLATHGRFGYDSRETFLVTGKQFQADAIPFAEQTPSPSESSTVIGARSATPTTQIADPKLTQTRPSYNQKLTLNQFYQMIRTLQRGNPLELLTLTACETAVGSNRDALGIAGISLQAGARSAIASLWQVDDQATAELITQFYQNLKQGMGRAKALQIAQKSWLQQHPGEYGHPSYWAAMILVGNWL
jgi:CHAT domain-containing protein